VTPAARLIAVVAGCACLLLAGVELVREAALAADSTISWPVSAWWNELTGDPTWSTTGVAAAVAATLAVVLIVLAARQMGERRRGPDLVQFAAEGVRARLSIAGLERALARRVRAVVPGIGVSHFELLKGGSGWRVRLEASLPPGDRERLRRRMLETLRGDLQRIGGMELVRLDIVVTPASDKRETTS
jgi:hypothetical protein